MNPETLYVVWNSDGSLCYGRTPDGIGMYWYEEDQEDEAHEDVCPVESVRYFDNHEEFDNWRAEKEYEAYCV